MTSDFGRKILMYYYCAILSQHNGAVIDSLDGFTF